MNEVMKMYADILVEITNKHVDKTFTYAIPREFQESISIGKRVCVPFGSKIIEGYVLNIKDETSIETKEIIEVLDEEPVLNKEMLDLGVFLQQKTLSTLSSCYAAMLPKALKAKKKVQINKKMKTYLRLTKDKEFVLEELKTPSQKEVVLLFQDESLIEKSIANKVSASAVKTLLKNGYVVEVEEEVYRYSLKEERKEENKVLNEEQEIAVKSILKSLGQEETFLLHGVTGSGKTEVYLQVIEEVLKNHLSALVLVPEISITTQFVERFNKRFPGVIAVLHSGLSDGEKYDEWRKILKGEASIVIGARSAIFAPLTNIGVIIMDEEHSESYKQENNPRYHALDVAKKRSNIHHCPLILGSATPTLHSMARAMKKKYQYLLLKTRANGATLPTVEIIDMEEEVKKRHMILSRELECRIIEKLNKKEQVMLLLNRRGHSTIITCSSCGFTYRCPNCDITLTYHKTSKNLRCHYCGYTKYIDDLCPNCHEKALNYYGLGTEKLEEYLSEVFPTARIIRMDADSTTNKGEYERITNEFFHHHYDIMLGTQMISKGLDFPDVSLVGVLNADATLNIPDYKSNERTFSLLYQASGRAGRDNTTGEVIIQTFNPENPILKFVQENDYMKFVRYEMNIRKTLKYPPFYYLANVIIKSKDYESASSEARKVKEYLVQHIDSSSIILGPATANMFLVNGIYHFEILIKYRFDEQLLPTFRELQEIYLSNTKVQILFDLND